MSSSLTVVFFHNQSFLFLFFFFQAEDGIRDTSVTGVQTCALPISTIQQAAAEESAVLDRGSQISQRQCAGCHERATRSSAPSYQEIATFYRRGFPMSAGNPDLRSRLASAVTHPQPGWGNFPPGPSESRLSLDDRIAVATWILDSFDRDKNGGEGVGK